VSTPRPARAPRLAALAVTLGLATGCGADGETATSSATTGAGGAGGAPSTSTTSAGGATGSGGGGLVPWAAPIERCGNGLDDDADDLVDEDCTPSFFVGFFPPSGGLDLDGGGHVARIEADASAPVRVVQTYHGTSAAGVAKIGPDLAAIFAHGKVAHLNLEPTGYSAAAYANPAGDATLDSDLHAAADALAGSLASHPGGRVLFTFGAEMNGNWVTWGCLPPASFIALHRYMHGVVAAALDASSPPVDHRRVRWVFGPNSTSSAGCAAPAAYYPGHAYVDRVGMSAYRSGTDSIQTSVVTPAKTLLDALALGPDERVDRFLVLQTASREVGDRASFGPALVSALAADSDFAGLIWFDAADWALLSAAAPPAPLEGYAATVAAIGDLPLPDAGLEGLFEPFFWDVPVSHPYYAELQSLRAAGKTSGCSASPPRFCPDTSLTRADAAVLLDRAFGLQAAQPGAFSDVPVDHPAAASIAAATAAGALQACAPSKFCPADPVTRGDLARALAALLDVDAGGGPAPFGDLGGVAGADAIQTLGSVGHVDACAAGAFCPDDPATRAAGAAWIVRASALPPAPKP
jgi:hypothetical protein